MEPSAFSHLPDILIAGNREYPDRPALIFGSLTITYAEAFDKARRVAHGLHRERIVRGDRVALLLDNGPEFVYAYFGILMAGAIAVPVNHMFKRDEIKYILEDSQSRYLVTGPVYLDVAEELNGMIPGLAGVRLAHHLLREQTDPHETGDLAQMGKGDDAVFLYTSGTTGHPKAAMLTHGNLLANVASCTKVLRLTRRDTILCFLPLFHSFAATVCMLLPLACGARTVILKSPRPAKKLLRALRNNRVTIFVGIPSIFAILNDIKIRWPRWLIKLLNPVRLAISGAAALPAEVFSAFEAKFGVPLLEGYGLTEAAPVVSINPLTGKRKPGSIGRPIPDVSVKIISEEGQTLATGQEGELCVKGANVMRGYFGREAESAQVLKDGWLLTGDMAKIDAEGYITIMGRKKEMVNVRGLNVYPREIEEVLYQHPLIREAAVIGIPDAHKGEVPRGFVVLRNQGSTTEHEILAYLRDHLAQYKIPRKIDIRTELPKNASGKILKGILLKECLKIG